MNPKDYFIELVEPTYREFLTDETDVRRAILACMVTYHMVDAIAVERDIEPRVAFAEIAAACPTYSVIKSICLAAKHISPTQKGFEDHRLDRVRRGRGAAFSDGSYFSDGSTFAEHRDAVVLDPASGRLRDVSHALRASISHLRVLVGL